MRRRRPFRHWMYGSRSSMPRRYNKSSTNKSSTRPHSSAYARRHGWTYNPSHGWQAGPVFMVDPYQGVMTRTLTPQGYYTAWTAALG